MKTILLFGAGGLVLGMLGATFYKRSRLAEIRSLDYANDRAREATKRAASQRAMAALHPDLEAIQLKWRMQKQLTNATNFVLGT